MAERADDTEGGRILSVHLGHSANCSSVGSLVDVLFVSTVAASAILAAVTVLLEKRGAGADPQADAEAEAETDDSRSG